MFIKQVSKKLIRINIPLSIGIIGTIIDFETTHWDVRQGELITAGFLNNSGFVIYQRLQTKETEFKEILREKMKNIDRPFYAFNKEFEEGFLGFVVDNDLQKYERESAFGALLNEGLLEYYNSLCDPCFNDEIPTFWDAYALKNDPVFVSKIIRHNYCCLAKEYYLYLKREKEFALTEIHQLPSSAQIEKKFIRSQLGF